MKKAFTLLVCIMLTFTLIFPTLLQISKAEQIVVDYIFSNGNIITMDYFHPSFEAIAIKDGVIVNLGTTEDILRNYTTEGDTSYDMEGRTIMPGIIDGHTHYMRSLFWVDAGPMYEAQELALSYGYTTLNEKSMVEEEIQDFLEAEQNGSLRLRTNFFPSYNYPYLDENNETIVIESWYPENAPILDPDRMFRIPGIKIFVDGAYGNRGFPAMSQPYTQEMIDAWDVGDPYGNLYFNQSALNATVKIIHDKGFSCAFHAMGDRAIETVLNAIEYAVDGLNNENARHQIEHNSFFREDLIARAISLNTIHSVRGYYPTYWQEEDAAFYSDEWEEWYVNRYSLPGLGIHSYLETDYELRIDPSDVSHTRNVNPFLHLWGLVTRKAIDTDGVIHEPDPWVAEHEISVELALRMMTIEGAYAVKQEDYIGSLEIGKYADLIVLTDNPITVDVDNLKDIEVMLTMVGGKIEYIRASPTFPLVPEITPSTFAIALLATLSGLLIIITLHSKRSRKK